jgi:hypothetical protein
LVESGPATPDGQRMLTSPISNELRRVG